DDHGAFHHGLFDSIHFRLPARLAFVIAGVGLDSSVLDLATAQADSGILIAELMQLGFPDAQDHSTHGLSPSSRTSSRSRSSCASSCRGAVVRSLCQTVPRFQAGMPARSWLRQSSLASTSVMSLASSSCVTRMGSPSSGAWFAVLTAGPQMGRVTSRSGY